MSLWSGIAMVAEDRDGHVLTGADARGHYHRALDLRRRHIGDPMKSGPEGDGSPVRKG